jgi:hypothetical protein
MSKQYDETNRGALFKNDRKESDNHPDLSGKINVDGKDYWLSGWTKRNDDNSFKVLSLSIKPKEQQGGKPAPASRSRNEDYADDDIPF